MRLLCIALMALFFSTKSFSQTTKISGRVVDAQNKGIPSATVSLLKAKDTSLVKLALSDKKGDYEFAGVAEGTYMLSVSYVGLIKTFSSSFDVAANASVEAPVIAMKEAATGLNNVTVQARRPLVEAKIDKMVVNVDASPTNAGTTALDVLEKSPGITVDRDGNISLKGKQGVIVLMDGKPAYLSGQDLANLLRNMPSSQLDQIEIMTQPSAKFDASGNSGVINLKMKKNRQMGLNGSVSLSYVQGRYPKSPNSFNINYRKGKVNLFSNLSYSYWSGFNNINLNRKFRQNGQLSSVFDQVTEGMFEGNNLSGRFGLDYSLNKKTTIGFLVNGSYNPRRFDANTITNIYDGDGNLDSTNKAFTSSKDPWRNGGVNLNFRRTFNKPGRELTADVDFVQYISRGTQIADNFSFDNKGMASGNPYLLRGNLPSDITIYSGKIDYVHPLNKEAKLEAGVKTSYVTTDNDAQYTLFDHANDEWIKDVVRSNHFLYEENINAAYINYSRQIKKWGVQTGLRMEHTHSVGNQKTTGEKFPRDYAQLFPTAYVSYNMNDNNKWALSYGRRVERPNYQDMNPFQRFLDQYTYQQGNPYLTPQFSHNIELTHNFMSVLNTTLNYTNTTDIINDILKQNDATKVTFLTKENIAKRRNIGLAVSFNKSINKWWTTSVFVNAFNNRFEGLINNKPLDVQMTGMMANTSQQFRFAKTWNAEVSGFYRSRMQEGGIMIAHPMGVFSFGVGKQVLKGKGTLRLNITDPFYVQQFKGTTRFDNLDVQINSRWDNRRAGLSFTYRFSKGENAQPQQRRRTSSAQEEQNRVGGGGNQ